MDGYCYADFRGGGGNWLSIASLRVVVCVWGGLFGVFFGGGSHISNDSEKLRGSPNFSCVTKCSAVVEIYRKAILMAL